MTDYQQHSSLTRRLLPWLPLIVVCLIGLGRIVWGFPDQAGRERPDRDRRGDSQERLLPDCPCDCTDCDRLRMALAHLKEAAWLVHQTEQHMCDFCPPEGERR